MRQDFDNRIPSDELIDDDFVRGQNPYHTVGADPIVCPDQTCRSKVVFFTTLRQFRCPTMYHAGAGKKLQTRWEARAAAAVSVSGNDLRGG
jgi:hypothetical protein